MVLESPASCPFCTLDPAANLVLHRGRDFYALADFAPQADAHVLIIPKQHYPHLAAIPAALDEEFLALKERIGRFVLEQYGELTYWENGVFGQSVPHAHLHVMSIGFDPALYEGEGLPFETLADLRGFQVQEPRHYFTVEHAGINRYLPPSVELHRRLLRYGRETMGGLRLLTAEQRRTQAAPYLEMLARRWEVFQRDQMA